MACARRGPPGRRLAAPARCALLLLLALALLPSGAGVAAPARRPALLHRAASRVRPLPLPPALAPPAAGTVTYEVALAETSLCSGGELLRARQAAVGGLRAAVANETVEDAQVTAVGVALRQQARKSPLKMTRRGGSWRSHLEGATRNATVPHERAGAHPAAAGR